MSDEALSIYDEIEIEDMTFDETLQIYQYPCPCGDKFQITLDDLRDEEDIAVCPSCSLMIRVIFDKVRSGLSSSFRSSADSLPCRTTFQRTQSLTPNPRSPRRSPLPRSPSPRKSSFYQIQQPTMTAQGTKATMRPRSHRAA